MHLPVNRNISLAIESDTVIHSWWVPRLGGKRDAVPGRINRIWFKIDSDVINQADPAQFLGECAEFCGVEHARMRKRVFAHSEQGYEDWVQRMKTPVVLDDKEFQAKGEALFSSAGCAGCHTILGNKTANGKTGPNLTHFGDRHSVGAGAGLFDPDGIPMTDAEKLELLKKWIHNPDDIKYGTTAKTEDSRVLDGMNIPRELSPEEIDTLAKYLLAEK
jgi:cytochrome c oxidase subunit 2